MSVHDDHVHEPSHSLTVSQISQDAWSPIEAFASSFPFFSDRPPLYLPGSAWWNLPVAAAATDSIGTGLGVGVAFRCISVRLCAWPGNGRWLPCALELGRLGGREEVKQPKWGREGNMR